MNQDLTSGVGTKLEIDRSKPAVRKFHSASLQIHVQVVAGFILHSH